MKYSYFLSIFWNSFCIYFLLSSFAVGSVFASQNFSPLRFDYELLLDSETKISLSSYEKCEMIDHKILYSSSEKKFWREEDFSLSFLQKSEKCVITFSTPYMSNFSLQEKQHHSLENIDIIEGKDSIVVENLHISFENQSSFSRLDVKKIIQDNSPEIITKYVSLDSVEVSGVIKIQSEPENNSIIFSGEKISITSDNELWNGVIELSPSQELNSDTLSIPLAPENSVLHFSGGKDEQPLFNLVVSDYDCKKNKCVVLMNSESEKMEKVSEVSVEKKRGNSILSFRSSRLAGISIIKKDNPKSLDTSISKKSINMVVSSHPKEGIQAVQKSSGGGGGSYLYTQELTHSIENKDEDENEDKNRKTKKFFIDVEDDHWAQPYIEKLLLENIITGRSSELFAPEENITRAEFIKIALLSRFTVGYIARCEKENFSDIFRDQWYLTYVCKAKEIGVIQGYEDGTFLPNMPITRAEALKIIFEVQKITVSVDEEYLFPDVSAEEWFAPYVSYGKKEGIIKGRSDGNFYPYEPLLRSEATKLIVELF